IAIGIRRHLGLAQALENRHVSFLRRNTNGPFHGGRPPSGFSTHCRARSTAMNGTRFLHCRTRSYVDFSSVSADANRPKNAAYLCTTSTGTPMATVADEGRGCL